MNTVSIIGAGRLGTTLAHALSKKGFRIKALSCKTDSSAKESRKIIGQGRPSTDNARTAEAAEIVIICLPDEEMATVVAELSGSRINWPGKLVIHCSGILPAAILDPLKGKGAMTGSVHPVQSFPQKKTAPNHFKNIYFGLEGCGQALALTKKIVRKLGGHPFILEANDKPLYHAACSTASNLSVVLLGMAVSMLKEVGLKQEKGLRVLLPLIKGTLHNVRKFDISASLSGPIVRGDLKTVRMHLEALQRFPSYLEIYRKLAKAALEMAKSEKKISSKKVKAMRSLLEDR
jgi:predicted short-subunit dehydrogenase-like oxidoreductase (DUF2520 family)